MVKKLGNIFSIKVSLNKFKYVLDYIMRGKKDG